MRPRLATLALAGLLAACGSDPDGGTVRDLLVREPDLSLHDLGVVRPSVERQWGRLGGEGWQAKTRTLRDGRAFVVSYLQEASLTLPAARPRDRELSFEAWVHSADADFRSRAQVRLGGEQLGEIELGTAPATYTFATRAEQWRLGPNELAIHVQRVVHGGGEGLALAEVRYGPERLVRHDPQARTLRLAPGTGVRYTVEEFSPARLTLAGRSDGEGELEVVLRRVSPVAAAPAAGAQPLAIHVARTLEAELPIPPARGDVIEVELFWSAESDAPLLLERLAVHDSAELRLPPIVLISIDTLAARHTSLYGYPRRTTPCLEAFAKEALVFERCSSNAPWTNPSYSSLFTGFFPTSALMNLGKPDSRYMPRLPREYWTVAESLRASGYRTAAFIDAIQLDERFGFAQGFEHFDRSAAEIAVEEPQGGLRHIVPRALAWLDSLGGDEPYFLFVHAYDVHGPYLPDAPWKGRFRSDELAQGGRELDAGTMTHTFRSIPAYISGAAYADGEIPERLPAAPFVEAYDEEILALDSVLGGLFDALRERGVLERAIVVVTADHGESTDDHDYFGHGLLYDETIHVPLVVRLPGGAGGREPSSVQLVDLYPTLLDLIGLPARRSYLHGRSFAPLLRGEALPSVPTFSSGGAMRQTAVELDGWKLIEMYPGVESPPWTMLSNPRLPRSWVEEHAPEFAGRPITPERFQAFLQRLGEGVLPVVDALRAELGGPVYELYHLDDDPRETDDLAPTHPEKVEELQRRLREAQAACDALSHLVQESLVPLSSSDLDELEKLGYVDRGFR